MDTTYTHSPRNISDTREGEDVYLKPAEIGSIIACAFGIIGNILNFLVFRRPAFSHLSVSVLLRALAVIDIFVLLIQNVAELELKLTTSKYVSLEDYQYNQVITYFLLCFATSSAWIIVIISIERAIAMTCPLRVKLLFTKKRAFLFSLFTYILMLILYIPMLILKRKIYESFPLPGYYAAMYTMIPSVVIAVCNGVAMWKLCQRPSLGNLPVENRGTTIMLTVNSIAFVVLTLPYPLYRIADKRTKRNNDIGDILLLCNGLNHMLNFVFYGISGSLFRKELKGLLCGRFYKGKEKGLDNSKQNISKRSGSRSVEEGMAMSTSITSVTCKQSTQIETERGSGQ